MSTFITPPSAGASLMRGFGVLSGWTSYEPPTSATGSWAMIIIPGDATAYEFTVQVDGGASQTFSFSAAGNPGDDSIYLGAGGDPPVDAGTLASAISSAFGITSSADGQGNFTLTSSTTGSGSSLSISGPFGFSNSTFTGSNAFGPSGQVGSVTLLSAIPGKTYRIVSAYAMGIDFTTNWNGTLSLGYGNGLPLFSQDIVINNGPVTFPASDATIDVGDLWEGLTSQGIVASFASNEGDDIDDFAGGALEIVVICDLQ